MFKSAIIASCGMLSTQAIKINTDAEGHYAYDKLRKEGTLRVGSLFKNSASSTYSSTSSGDKNGRHAIVITEVAPILYMDHHYDGGNQQSTVLEYMDKSLVLGKQNRRGGRYAKIQRAPKKHTPKGFGGLKGRGSWGGDRLNASRKMFDGSTINKYGNKSAFDPNHIVIQNSSSLAKYNDYDSGEESEDNDYG